MKKSFYQSSRNINQTEKFGKDAPNWKQGAYSTKGKTGFGKGRLPVKKGGR